MNEGSIKKIYRWGLGCKLEFEIIPYTDDMIVPESMDAPMPDGLRPCIDYARVGTIVERLLDKNVKPVMRERVLELRKREEAPLIEEVEDRTNQRWCSYCHDWHKLDKFDVVNGRAGGVRGYCKEGYREYMREYMRRYRLSRKDMTPTYGVHRAAIPAKN